MVFVFHTTQNKVYLILSYLILSYLSYWAHFENLGGCISVDTTDCIKTLRFRLVEMEVFYVKDRNMLCKECYATWWLRDDKSQGSIRRDTLQDPQNIPAVAPEGLLNRLFYLSNTTLMAMHTIGINVYHGNT